MQYNGKNSWPGATSMGQRAKSKEQELRVLTRSLNMVERMASLGFSCTDFALKSRDAILNRVEDVAFRMAWFPNRAFAGVW